MLITTVSILTVILLCALAVRHLRKRPGLLRRAQHPERATHPYLRAKPAWVADQVIKLKVRMPHEGCRSIARAFNSLHRQKGESVGKSYVAQVIRRNQARILLERRKLKRRPRQQGPRNLTWGMDLTFLDPNRVALGIIDHGTRCLLTLRQVRIRTSVEILRFLLDTIETYGRPRFLRTDNELVLTSFTMRLALLVLGIRPQTIDPFCPWQNGRIERLFGTFKHRLRLWRAQAGVPDHVQPDLDTFRRWYNHVRPHQSLDGLTPAMAWAGLTEHRTTPRFFTAWDDILTGWISPV